MKKVIIKVRPTVLESTEDKLFTIYDSNNKGGAIISDTSKEKALEKFKEASKLACAVKTLTNRANGINEYYEIEYLREMFLNIEE